MTHVHQEALGGTEDKSLLHMSTRVKLHPSTPSPCSSSSWFPLNLPISRSRRFQWHLALISRAPPPPAPPILLPNPHTPSYVGGRMQCSWIDSRYQVRNSTPTRLSFTSTLDAQQFLNNGKNSRFPVICQRGTRVYGVWSTSPARSYQGHRIADTPRPEQKKIFAFLPGLPPPGYHITSTSHTSQTRHAHVAEAGAHMTYCITHRPAKLL
ncbi:hypothetical protein BDN71DRAFT_1498704 [Pleurotus eryngii]|uniref:Uncharacterized protein n=1 Tax=Pleurotus eryngii TaxID=5323 RepID=A0A9P5ZPT7_PLEER|nr:hypothetical protein BDN71DRAFT_1498704 [Pleurotus eryngii]